MVLLDDAATLCRRPDIEPRQVIHVPCDEFRPQDLRRALTLARELTKVIDRNTPTQRVWLLDEVTSIEGGTATLKSARDGTAFGDDTVVVTGGRWSDGADIKGHLLAGRAGTVSGRRIRHLHPMNFRAFLAATRPAVALPPAVHPAELQNFCCGSVAGRDRFRSRRLRFRMAGLPHCGWVPESSFRTHNRRSSQQ